MMIGLQRDAYSEAHQQGYDEGYADGHEAGYLLGVEEASDRNEPKRPRKIKGFVTFADCPVCGQCVSARMSYCYVCGQKLNWDYLEEK